MTDHVFSCEGLALPKEWSLASNRHSLGLTGTDAQVTDFRLELPGPILGSLTPRLKDLVRSFEEALKLFARLELPLESARTRLELARTVAPDQPALAVSEGRAALSSLDRLGASSDADIAAALLRSWGASGRAVPREAGVLTRREQEILALLAAGLSNQEIAGRLFISRKTAAHHVSNLLAKLNVRNRAEAAAYAARISEGRDPA